MKENYWVIEKYGIVVNIDTPINTNYIGVIYKIENKINNKLYIGQTINYKRRLKEHCRSKKPAPLHSAFKKYGLDNFKFSIIDAATTIDELNEKEIHYISTYDSRNKAKGYNIENGGRNSVPTEETLEKMSKSHIGIKQSEEWIKSRIHKQGSDAAKKYGKAKTQEEKKELSLKSPKYWKGKTRDEETRQKMSRTKKEKGLSNAQKELICKKVVKQNLWSY